MSEVNFNGALIRQQIKGDVWTLILTDLTREQFDFALNKLGIAPPLDLSVITDQMADGRREHEAQQVKVDTITNRDTIPTGETKP